MHDSHYGSVVLTASTSQSVARGPIPLLSRIKDFNEGNFSVPALRSARKEYHGGKSSKFAGCALG